jgi:hypothetical protein
MSRGRTPLSGACWRLAAAQRAVVAAEARPGQRVLLHQHSQTYESFKLSCGHMLYVSGATLHHQRYVYKSSAPRLVRINNQMRLSKNLSENAHEKRLSGGRRGNQA